MKVEFLKSVILRPDPKSREKLNAKIGAIHEVADDVAERLFARGLAVPARRDAEVGAEPVQHVTPPPPVKQEPQEPLPPSSSETPTATAPKVRSARTVATRVKATGPLAVQPVEAPVAEGGGLAEKLSG